MDEKFVPGEGIENEEIENTSVNEAEEVIAAYESASSETVEEDIEGTSEYTDDETSEDTEDVPEEDEENTYFETAENVAVPEKKNGYKTSAMIAWILVAVLALGDVYYYMTNIYNKYNHMGYLDTNGYTIGDAVAGMGMDFEEFKEMYGLPKDMKKDTYMNAAQSMIPIYKMAELNNVDFETLKSEYDFGDEITEDSTWGEAIDTMTLKTYVGEESFEEFKTEYGFGDEITLETKWGDVRKTVEKKQVATRLEKAKAKDSEDESKDAEDNDNTVDTSNDTNAEDENSEAEVNAENTDATAENAE